MAGGGSDPVLVIKLGALGDFIQALGPLAAIRRHHADAPITLLTTQPFKDLAEASGYVDHVSLDTRPGALAIGGWLALRRFFRGGNFSRVYDLQTSDRSSSYRRLFWPQPAPEWSGIAAGCSHPHANPERNSLHTLERQAEQLAMAGIEDVPAPDLAWAEADLSRFALPERMALIVPGGARHRPAKRWPAASYGDLAAHLSVRGLTPVLLGAADEADVTGDVAAGCPEAIDLAGKTSLLEAAALARRASLAVGNDTGPMHMTAVAGCPSLILYSHDSDPALCAQRGASVAILRRPSLADLSVDEVRAEIERLTPP